MIKNSAIVEAPATYDNDFFSRAYAPWLVSNPRHQQAATVLLASILEGAQVREQRMQQYACDMPETLVVSLTSVCNLRCQFCGASDVVTGPKTKLDGETLGQALRECREIGIRRIALIGGEPLLFDNVIGLLETHPDFFFSVYTNGLTLTPNMLDRFESLANAILIVNVSATSMQGLVSQIEPRVLEVLGELRERGALFGYAATVHQNNRELFMRADTLHMLHRHQPRLGVLFDYLPEYDNEEDPLRLSTEERAAVVKQARQITTTQPMMFMCTPEDEDIMGGCGAAGRSFIHLGADGSLGPCPFVPYAQHRFPDRSLLDAICGEYFSELRDRSHAWESLDGPCAYRAAEHQLREISQRHGATRYSERNSQRLRSSSHPHALPLWQPNAESSRKRS